MEFKNIEVSHLQHALRRNHRLPAWHEFCEKFIAKLPYSEFITEYPCEKED